MRLRTAIASNGTGQTEKGSLLLVRRACPRSRHTFGCYLAADEFAHVLDPNESIRTFIIGNEPIIPKSGDKNFDRTLAQTLAKISDVFSVLPGFGYYDDHDSPNAHASPARRMGRTDGTVLFGGELLR